MTYDRSVIILLLLSLQAFSGDRLSSFTSVDPQLQLSHDCISCILQDSRGFLWIGTERGLDKYDGYNITEYLHDPDNPRSISHNFIRTIFEDPADSGKVLWIGTKGGGLDRYDRETNEFSSFQHHPDDPTSLSHSDVKCIFKDRKGIYWIGTEGGGLQQFDRTTEKFFPHNFNQNGSIGLSYGYVFSMCEDHQDLLWIAAGGEGLYQYDRRTGKYYRYTSDPKDQDSLPYNVFAVCEDSEHDLWIGTQYGLRGYDRESDAIIRFPFKNGSLRVLDNANIWAIHKDRVGQLWIATMGNGLFCIDPKTDEFYNFQHVDDNPAAVRSNTLSSVCQDQSGNIWVGSYCSGITKLVPSNRKFELYRRIPGDPTNLTLNRISSLYEDAAGALWIGTLGGGLKTFDCGNKRFSQIQYIDETEIYAISASRAGEMWIASRTSLIEFNPSSGKFIHHRGKFSGYHPHVYTLIRRLSEKDDAIAGILEIGNSQDITREFEIDQPIPVLVTVLGEGNKDQLFDRGWIEKDGADNAVWQMDFTMTRHAEGGYDNRIQCSLLTLSPGKYRLRYVSDATHSYDNWSFEAPKCKELWGI